MNIGDEIDTSDGKGILKAIEGGGKVGVVEIGAEGETRTVYIRLPETKAEAES